MIMLGIICVAGCSAGCLLIRRVPVCPGADSTASPALSIIIPARNEEKNLVRLLGSVGMAGSPPVEVLVVDDASTDNTAAVAQTFGATVLHLESLPPGWTGKAWACQQGALHAVGELLLFLDADTFLQAGGLDRILSCWVREGDARLIVSLLPYHETRALYEQLSLVFNILMAAGAGGFGVRTAPRLFGQSLLIDKRTYFAAGGHSAVKNVVLENLRLANRLTELGGRIQCFSGRGALHMQMFPEGLSQMSQSWAKALLQGAGDSGTTVLAYAVAWISALWMAVILLALRADARPVWALYLLFAAQLYWLGRQFGNYRLLTCLIYPLPLAYYCAVFAQSALRRSLNRRSIWKGREV